MNLLLTNGKFYTMDATRPSATAITIRDDTIEAIGDEKSLRLMLFGEYETVDLGGRCVVPGLVDAHAHFEHFSLALQRVNLDEATSLGEVLQRIESAAANLQAGEWLQGWGWSQDAWDSPQFPTAQQLDAVVPHNPVFLSHKSGHAGWANTVALRIGKIDAGTSDPDGGSIQRDENGRATGILFESPAMQLVAQHIPPATEEQLITAMQAAQQYCWEAGLTGIHDFDGRSCFQALQTLKQRGELGLRFIKNIPAALIEHAVGVGLKSGFGDDWLRIGGIKMFADGALGPRTALMIRPYEGEPHNRGLAVLEKEEMMQIAHLAYPNQLSLTTHAIGDQAVHDVLDVYESLRNANYPTHPQTPNRIEHVQIIHDADKARLAQLGIVASMQPIHATSDYEMADRYWGKRAANSYAIKTMLNSGATVVFGSDAPVEKIDPLLGIHAAVTRQRADNTPDGGWYPEQRFTMHETIYAFTMAAAITAGQQARQGSITVGKLADLTILDADIFAVAGDEILDVGIAGTMVGGAFKYRGF